MSRDPQDKKRLLNSFQGGIDKQPKEKVVEPWDYKGTRMQQLHRKKLQRMYSNKKLPPIGEE